MRNLKNAPALFGLLFLGAAIELVCVDVRRVIGRLLEPGEVELTEVFDGLCDPNLERDLRLPSEDLLGLGDVGSALLGVVAREGQVDDLRARTRVLDRKLRQLQDGELARVANVDRSDRLFLREEEEGYMYIYIYTYIYMHG